jgi:hypothetical protein
VADSRFKVEAPPEDMKIKVNQRMELRFAEVGIESIDETGLMTLVMSEDVE